MSSFISDLLFFFSCLFSSLLFHLLVSSLLLSRLLFSCIVLSLFLCLSLSLSVSVFFLCLSLCFCLSLSLCLSVSVWCCVLWCCVVCVVWCVARLGTQKKPSVCRCKTSPCVPAPRAHVLPHVRVVPVHTGTFCIYTRRFFGRTHGGQGVIVSAAYQNLATCGHHVLQRFTTRNQWILPIFSLRTGRESNTLPIPPNIRCA